MADIMHVQSSRTAATIRRCLLAGTTVTALLTVGFGGWATTTELSGAVIAPGLLTVESSVKRVQHPNGGVIGELLVRDGSEVKAGDILLRLDETIARSNLLVLQRSIDEFVARRARLKAEQDGAARFDFPEELLARAAQPHVADVLRDERILFDMRASARAGLKSQLRERILQLREQVKGLNEQVVAKDKEIELIGQELKGVRELWRQNLVPITRVTSLERDTARLYGERGSFVSNIAQTQGKAIETELQIIQIDQDLRTETGKELAEIRARLAELTEKKIAAEDQLRRIDIRSPQDGVVHQLSVHTVGGVITAGEQVMLIVPRADNLNVEARIQPHDVDQLKIGQRAILRFSAFNQRTTPEIFGIVDLVSADITQDQKTGGGYYTVRIRMPDDELARLDGLKLLPGMPVEAFIQTQARTVLSYLTKPIEDQLMRSWREK